jgi:hypothetical protein
LLVIVLMDLGTSGIGLIARVPRDSELELLAGIDASSDPNVPRWMRTQSGSGWPQIWQETRDDERLLDVEASARAAWFGRWHLQRRASVLNNMVSIRSHEMAMFWRAARQVTAGMSLEQRDAFWASIRRWLAIDGVVHTTNQSISIPVDGRMAQLVDRTIQIQATHPPLRVHSNWQYDASPKWSLRSFAECLHRIAHSDGLSSPLVQATASRNVRPRPSHEKALIAVIASEAEHAQFDVALASPALLTRPVFQDGHWIAQYAADQYAADQNAADQNAAEDSLEWKRVPVYRVDRLTQGVLLPAGDWKLRFQYAPWWLPWSLGIAAIGWLLTALIVCRNVGFRLDWEFFFHWRKRICSAEQ